MVRLAITDFSTNEENEAFYIEDEFTPTQKIFTYNNFKKYSVHFSKYDIHDEIYSLNLLSKNYLLTNQFLVYITDEEFIILFNHKTIYNAKVNSSFITDDIIKSILITKHITMLSSGGEIDKIYFIVHSKYKYAIENILKQNTKNEKNEIIAFKLGEIEELVKDLNPLDTLSSHLSKNIGLLSFFGMVLFILFYLIPYFDNKFSNKDEINEIKEELLSEKKLLERKEFLLKKTQKNYESMINCINKKEKNND